EETGGTAAGKPSDISDVFNIAESSPKEGTIRLSLNPKTSVKVGDEIQMKVTLTAPGEDFEELFWAKVTEPNKPQEKVKEEEKEEPLMGLPDFVLVYQEKRDNKSYSWEELSELISD